MIWIILGLALWTLAHGFKRFAPDRRAAMGDAGRGAVTGAILISVVLMVIGYRAADPVFLWPAPGWAHPLNNLLMVLAVYLFAVGGARTGLARRLRHPMLTGLIVWSVAHLLVNGDLESLILFGGLGVWAVFAMVVINRAQDWTPPAPSPLGKEIGVAVTSVIVFAVIGFIHRLIGPQAIYHGG